MNIKFEYQTLFETYLASYRAGDASGCAAIYTPNAELHSPYGPPAIGRAAIEACHHDWVSGGGGGGENKTIKVLHADRSGDIGWCLAHYSDGLEENGTSLNVLERQADGNWLIRQCSLNDLE